MRKFFCFLDGQDNLPEQLNLFIEKLDALGDEVYVYTNVCKQNGNPSDLLYTIDTIINHKEENDEYVFASNISNLFQITYRLYHQIFDKFIYYQQDEVGEYPLSGVYKTIFQMKVSEKEILHKPIYTNNMASTIAINKCEIRDYKILLERNDNKENSFTEGKDNSSRLYNIVRKYYYIDGLYYLFEPVYADQKIVIYDAENDANQSENSSEFTYLGYHKLQYAYVYNEEIITKLFAMMDNISNSNLAEIEQTLEVMEQDMKTYYPFVLCMTCCILEDAIQLDRKLENSLFLLTFLIQVTSRHQYINQLLDFSIKSNLLSSERLFFIWNQCKRYLFTNTAGRDSTTGILMSKLYYKVYRQYEEKLTSDLSPIIYENRNDNLIVIFTTQFLSEKHAPTHTALERSYTLAKKMGKDIMLINTKEQLPRFGLTLVYHPKIGRVVESYSNKKWYQYKDLSIPFYQPREQMPSLLVIQNIIKMIRELKPSFIFCIGGSSIVADLCGKVVPEASIGTVFSSVPTTVGTFSVIGRKVEETEWNNLSKMGYEKENIIESIFTFEMNQKKSLITRDSLNIPLDQFVLVTVGTRLDADIDDEFIKMILQTFTLGTHIVFAGYFNKYEQFCSKYPELAKNSTYVGYYDDMLALMNICELYVNPRRFGGGFSIVEAFHEGIPGVTIRMGDIAVAAGDDFCVNNYQEMLKVIKKYIEDKEFYRLMSQKAREREKVVTDSSLAMENIVNKIQKSPLFF